MAGILELFRYPLDGFVEIVRDDVGIRNRSDQEEARKQKPKHRTADDDGAATAVFFCERPVFEHGFADLIDLRDIDFGLLDVPDRRIDLAARMDLLHGIDEELDVRIFGLAIEGKQCDRPTIHVECDDAQACAPLSIESAVGCASIGAEAPKPKCEA